MSNYLKIASSIILMTISLSCDKQVTVSAPEKRVPLSFFYVNSEPSGAEIYMDGRNTGLLTPDSLNWLDEGSHSVTLKLTNYRDTIFSINVSETERTFNFIDYHSNPKMLGRIFVKTNVPNSVIFMNDSATGTLTPDTIKNLIPGYYKIKTEASEHRPDSLVKLVRSNITSNAAFYLRDTSVWVDYRISTAPIPSNDITAINIDLNNQKWIGTNGDGVIVFDEKDFVIYNTSNSPLPGDFITAITVDSSNNVWIGSSDGAAKFDGVNWEIFSMDYYPMLSNYVTSFAISEDEQLRWIGTTHGILRDTGSGWAFINVTRTGLPHRWVTAMDYDANGNLWIGTNGFALVKYTPDGDWIKYFNPDGIGFIPGSYMKKFPTNFISAIGTFKGSGWFGHQSDASKPGGLSFFNGYVWKLSFSGLPSDIINEIKIDKNDRKWICTHAGLLTFRSYGVRTVFNNSSSPMLVSDVRDVAFDRLNNNVWVATFGGGFYKFKRDFN